MLFQKFLRNYYPPKILTFTRFCNVSVEQNPSEILKEQRHRKTKVPRLPQQDVYKFFEDNKLLDVYNLFPKKFLSKKFKAPEHFYIAHPNAAEIIANHLKTYCNDDRPFIEINPGPGILTEKLLKSKMKDIRLYEVNDQFVPYLKVCNIKIT